MSSSEDFSEFARRASRADLWNRPGLTRDQRFAALIGGLIGLNIEQDKLTEELSSVLAEGCSAHLAEDTIRQMAAYTGYVNASIGMAALDRALAARGVPPSAAVAGRPGEPTDDERYATGIKAYGALNPTALATIRAAFDGLAPDLANLTFRAFGDVYASSGQPLPLRQLATVAALACMGGVAPQLRFHFGASLHVGATQEQLVEVIYIVQYLAGMPAAYNAIVELKAAITSAGEPPPYR